MGGRDQAQQIVTFWHSIVAIRKHLAKIELRMGVSAGRRSRPELGRSFRIL